jgi:hypothetical protein
MEAEAQCAELVHLGLVEGIITDDSDVFLFGGNRVFRNMFNQSKTVECFLSSDLVRELGLDRGTLVRLAYLLGERLHGRVDGGWAGCSYGTGEGIPGRGWPREIRGVVEKSTERSGQEGRECQ